MIKNKTLGNLLRIILFVFGGLLVLPMVFYLVLLLFNLADADLLPEVERLMNERPPQIAANDNGYFAWIGIMGPADQPVHAWGYGWFQAVTDRERGIRLSDPFGDLPIQAEIREEPITSSESPCIEIQSCLEKVAAAPEVVRELLEKHRTTLERADQAIAFPAFQEAWRPNISLHSPFPPSSQEWHRLAAARFALAVAEGRHDNALEQLGREISFQIRYLEGSYSLVNKMMGVRNLGFCYNLLGQYMRREPEAARKQLVQINALLVGARQSEEKSG
jgi:hypothetical protein